MYIIIKNMLGLIIIISIVIGSAYLLADLYRLVSTPSITLDGGVLSYYKIVSDQESTPNIKLIDRAVVASSVATTTIITPPSLAKDEIRVVYLGNNNSFDSFRIIDCGSVSNCNLTLVIKLNKANRNIAINSEYIMNVDITKSLQITNKGLRLAQ
jgi:hypothetical protein